MLPTLTIALYNLYEFSILLAQEAAANDFDDLGSMLLGGFALAIVVAVLLVFVKLRLRDKKPQAADYLSISDVSERK